MKLDAKQLRVTKPTDDQLAKIERKPLYIVLDNVLDTYNIGGIFRLADATAAKEVILCGGSETPPSSRIHKAAVGTETWVPWSYESSSHKAIERLRRNVPGIKIIAVEQDKRAISINAPSFPPLSLRGGRKGELSPVAIVVGHETDGVTKEALDLVDVIVEIPMWGVNKSLNVIVSTALVVYKILEKF